MTGHGADTAGRADAVIRWVMATAVTAVAGVAAWTSYLHTVAVVVGHGEDTTTAALVPVTTDGLILAAGLVLLHCARSDRPAPDLARVLLALGIAATLAANVLHGIGHGPVGAVIAAWPATAFVGVSELALWLIRASGAVSPADAVETISAAPVAVDAAVSDEWPGAGWLPDILPPRTAAPTRTGFSVTATKTHRVAAVPAGREGVEHVRTLLAERPNMSGADIARALGVSDRHGRRLRAAALT